MTRTTTRLVDEEITGAFLAFRPGLSLRSRNPSPALNFYSRSALIASDRLLVPFDCDEFSRQALYTLLDNVAEIRADHNDELETEGIVVNQFQSRSSLPARLVNELKGEGKPVLEQPISSSVKVKESHERHLPLIHLDRNHRVTQEYLALYDSLGG